MCASLLRRDVNTAAAVAVVRVLLSAPECDLARVDIRGRTALDRAQDPDVCMLLALGRSAVTSAGSAHCTTARFARLLRGTA